MGTHTASTRNTAGPRALGRLMVATVGLVAAGACHDRTAPTDPEQPSRAAHATVSAAALPPWFSAYVAALPAESKPVWASCNLAGTMQQAGAPFVVGTNCRIMMVDGYPRRYVVYVPNHPNVVAGNDVPLVSMFHGSGQNGEHFYNESGWRAEADANGFIVVFGTGVQYRMRTGGTSMKWHAYNLLADIDSTWRPPGYSAGAPWPARDVTFTDRVLSDLIAQSNIDTLRMHASGFSNGGGFVSKLAVELGTRIASVASISNPYPRTYAPVAKIPYFAATGALDANVIADINANLLVGQPPVTSVPLIPDTLFTYVVQSQKRDSMAATLGLEPLTYSSTQTGTWTLMRWTTPVAGNLAGNVAWWGIIQGVEHEYPRGVGRFLPNGVPLAPNNPLNFDGPQAFYSFFRTHHK